MNKICKIFDIDSDYFKEESQVYKFAEINSGVVCKINKSPESIIVQIKSIIEENKSLKEENKIKDLLKENESLKKENK